MIPLSELRTEFPSQCKIHCSQAIGHDSLCHWNECFPNQGANKVSFTACQSGKLQLARTSPQVISTSPKILFDQQDWLQSFCNLNFLKKQHLPVGARTKITSPITKSTSPRLSDTTFFAQTLTNEVLIEHSIQIITFVVAIFQF